MSLTSTPNAILADVGPETYRENAFRVTGLPVTANTGELRRRENELRLERFGTRPRSGALPLAPTPDTYVVEAAIQLLRDPVRRLEEELFWFWPSADEPDAALEALEAGRIARAEELWANAEPGLARAVAVHNLAVLAHVRALDRPGPDDESRAYWRRALAHWRGVAGDDAFWRLVTARVAEIGDPRLGTDGAAIAGRIRARLPLALVEMGARTVVRAALEDAAGDARELLVVMRQHGFSADALATAVHAAAGTEISALRNAAESATDRAGADPERGIAAALHLLDQGEPVIAALSSILPTGDAALTALRDELAGAARRSVIAYCNHTDRWIEPEEPLLRAKDLAAGDARRAELADDLETVRANRFYDICWFCQERPPDPERAYEHAMYGDVDADWGPAGVRHTWKTLQVKVPRCSPCAKRHGPADTALAPGCAFILTGVIAGVVLLVMGHVFYGIAVPVGALMVLGGYVAFHDWLADQRAAPAARRFPPVVQRLEVGWGHGARPPGV